MAIARIDLKPCTLRKEDPNWRFALGASPVTEGLIVTLTDESGAVGHGYASATPHMGATKENLTEALSGFAALLKGANSLAIPETMAIVNAAPGNNQAKAAIDCALHDLKANMLGVPLYKLFGQKRADKIPILRILAIKTPEEMAAQAQKLVEAGYDYLKIKVHGDVEEDVARVRAIREQVGEDVLLTVDANQSYSVDNAIEALNRMDEFDIDLAEQPVDKADLEGLKRVTAAVGVTVEADESANSLDAVKRLVDERIVDAISLKIPKLGGLANTLEAARLCEEAGIAYRMGAAVGSRLLSAHALHLAVTLPQMWFACELGEFARLLDDPFDGIEVENGRLHLPGGPGCGVHWRGSVPSVSRIAT